MAAALPVTKLAGLLVKTLSKPLAKRIKLEFSRYPATQTILVTIGQSTHQITSRLQILSAGYRIRSVKPLDSDKAMAKGADFLGDFIVFFVAGAVTVSEYNSSKEKERKKTEEHRARQRAEQESLRAKLKALDVRLKALEKVVKANSASILNFGEIYQEPEEVHVAIVSDDEGEEGKGLQSPDPLFREVETTKSTAPTKFKGTEPQAKIETTAKKVQEKTINKDQERQWWNWIWPPFGRGGDSNSGSGAGGA